MTRLSSLLPNINLTTPGTVGDRQRGGAGPTWVRLRPRESERKKYEINIAVVCVYRCVRMGDHPQRSVCARVCALSPPARERVRLQLRLRAVNRVRRVARATPQLVLLRL